MKTRIQLRLDQGLKKKAVEVAREHRVTLSEVIREFLASYVSTPANLSSQPDVSVHGHDEVLSRLEAIELDLKRLAEAIIPGGLGLATLALTLLAAYERALSGSRRRDPDDPVRPKIGMFFVRETCKT